MKKWHPLTVILVVISIAIGFVIGSTLCRGVIADDCFELKGQKDYVIALGATVSYADEGVEAISFGRDMSHLVSIKTNMTQGADGSYSIDTSKPGDYYIIYTVDDWRFSGLQKVRTFTVGGGE